MIRNTPTGRCNYYDNNAYRTFGHQLWSRLDLSRLTMRTMQQAQGVEFRHLAPWVLRWVIYLLQPIRLYNFVSLPSGMQARFSCAFYPTGGGGVRAHSWLGGFLAPAPKAPISFSFCLQSGGQAFFAWVGGSAGLSPPPPPRWG